MPRAGSAGFVENIRISVLPIMLLLILVAPPFVSGQRSILEWGSPILIEDMDTGNAEFPSLAIDQTGNAFAIWRQTQGNEFKAMVSQFIRGTGWQLILLCREKFHNNIFMYICLASRTTITYSTLIPWP